MTEHTITPTREEPKEENARLLSHCRAVLGYFDGEKNCIAALNSQIIPNLGNEVYKS